MKKQSIDEKQILKRFKTLRNFVRYTVNNINKPIIEHQIHGLLNIFEVISLEFKNITPEEVRKIVKDHLVFQKKNWFFYAKTRTETRDFILEELQIKRYPGYTFNGNRYWTYASSQASATILTWCSMARYIYTPSVNIIIFQMLPKFLESDEEYLMMGNRKIIRKINKTETCWILNQPYEYSRIWLEWPTLITGYSHKLEITAMQEVFLDIFDRVISSYYAMLFNNTNAAESKFTAEEEVESLLDEKDSFSFESNN